MPDCTILFFGHTAEIARDRKISMPLSEGVTARQVFNEVVLKYPEFAGLRLNLSLNQKYATGNEILNDGDELAVFANVSGG